MDVGMISSRYVKALFSLAKETKTETRVYEEMKMLTKSFDEESELRTVLRNPLVAMKEKESLLVTAAGGRASELFVRFVRLVVQRRRESLLPLMAHIYIGMHRENKKITRVLFETPAPVDEETKEHLSARLKKETGNTIEFTGAVKPELIGGFVLRIGGYRIDASYAHSLREIRNQLIEKN